MRVSRLVFACAATVLLVAAPRPALAQDAQALRQEIDQLRQQFQAAQKEYGDRLAALEAKLATLPPSAPAAGGAQAPAPAAVATATVPPGAEGAGGPSGSLPVYGGGAASSKIFNPDIAVIGDFLGASGRNTVNPPLALQMHEAEASFQAVVDPYARADFFIAYGEEGVELEEGYATLTSLPLGLLAKVGKQRAAFGKVNTMHNHVLSWTDRPLVTDNLVNGEDGITDAGISVAKLISNPWVFLEATGQVYRGDSGNVFHSSKPGELSYVGHIRGYQDITENTNIDLGASYARGHNPSGLLDSDDPDRFVTNLFGVDATLRWRPLQRSIYHSFLGRSELIWSRRDQPSGLQSAFGFYVSGDYQFGRRWIAGARFDRSGQADNASLTDNSQSLLVTFLPSEFSQIRGQYRRTKYADVSETAQEFLFQFQFAIGAHGAHPF